jgi:hypothetical protein
VIANGPLLRRRTPTTQLDLFMKVHVPARSIVLSALALCLASCTIGFDRDYKKAVASADTLNRNGLAGAWEGQWTNEGGGGHGGGLWAIATPLGKTGDTERYRFRYKAIWAKVFRGVFTTEHDAKRKGSSGAYELGGQKDLGAIGGVIRFTGSATPSEFKAHYESKANTGEFKLKRPGA